MPDKRVINGPATLDGSTLRVIPTRGRRIDLKTIAQVKTEMSRVYRGMRDGSIEMGDGTKLTFVLAQIGKMIESSELEKRIAILEDTQHEQQR